MDKTILSSAELMIRPLMKAIKNNYKQTLRTKELQQKRFPQPNSVINEEAERDCSELQKFLLGEEEFDRTEKGLALILSELSKFPNKERVIEDLTQAGERLLPQVNDSEVPEFRIFETLQEMFGLAQETYDTFYQIGSSFFNQGKMEEALNVFVLLTNLNNFVFESWLGLGCCWQYKKKYPEALYAFSMASLLDFDHPAPHLFSAEVYAEMQNIKISSETLDLALSKMDAKQEATFGAHIDYLKRLVVTKEGNKR
jgi:tetratricopeptide (TPR) repeat protein